jgi:CheY-like chemotaxis protein
MPPLNVLVVDDDALVLMSTALMCEDLGHKVTEAYSGAKALELLQQQAFDLVITDYAMPGMTGADLILRLADTVPSLPFILATGYAVLPKGMPAGLLRLNKPFDQEQLASMIDLAIRIGAADRKLA